MKTVSPYLASIVLALSPTQLTPDQDSSTPTKPQKEQTITIGTDVDASFVVTISGVLVLKDEESFMGKCYKMIIEDAAVTDHGCSYSPATTDQTLLNQAAQTTNKAYPTPNVVDRLVLQKHKSDQTVVANFNLFIVNHAGGEIKYSTDKKVFYDMRPCKYSAHATVRYEPPIMSTDSFESDNTFFKVLLAFLPLVKDLECENVWVQAKTTTQERHDALGIVWGGQDISIDKITLPYTPPASGIPDDSLLDLTSNQP